MRQLLLGVDIGGTFTDVASFDAATKRWRYGKVLTKYPDLEEGVAGAVEKFEIDLPGTARFVHGTTIVTNTVIEGKGSKTGLVTTRGFADVLEIARSDKAEPHGHLQDKFGPGHPSPLVPRHLRLEVDERIAYDGSVLRGVDRESVSRAIGTFKRQSVDTIAVSLINSYVNRSHEEEVREIFTREYPEASVHISSDVSPTMREYERTSTTV